MAAQLMGTKLAPARCDKSCSERATISLPVPLSPVINTVELDAATTGSKSRIARMASLSPINRSGTLDVDKVWVGAKKRVGGGKTAGLEQSGRPARRADGQAMAAIMVTKSVVFRTVHICFQFFGEKHHK
jgi:hypothetical protein